MTVLWKKENGLSWKPKSKWVQKTLTCSPLPPAVCGRLRSQCPEPSWYSAGPGTPSGDEPCHPVKQRHILFKSHSVTPNMKRLLLLQHKKLRAIELYLNHLCLFSCMWSAILRLWPLLKIYFRVCSSIPPTLHHAEKSRQFWFRVTDTFKKAIKDISNNWLFNIACFSVYRAITVFHLVVATNWYCPV